MSSVAPNIFAILCALPIVRATGGECKCWGLEQVVHYSRVVRSCIVCRDMIGMVDCVSELGVNIDCVWEGMWMHYKVWKASDARDCAYYSLYYILLLAFCFYTYLCPFVCPFARVHGTFCDRYRMKPFTEITLHHALHRALAQPAVISQITPSWMLP